MYIYINITVFISCATSDGRTDRAGAGIKLWNCSFTAWTNLHARPMWILRTLPQYLWTRTTQNINSKWAVCMHCMHVLCVCVCTPFPNISMGDEGWVRACVRVRTQNQANGRTRTPHTQHDGAFSARNIERRNVSTLSSLWMSFWCCWLNSLNVNGR